MCGSSVLAKTSTVCVRVFNLDQRSPSCQIILRHKDPAAKRLGSK